MKAAGRTDTGKVRNKNEDDYIIRKTPYPILAVADGMGGHKAGDVASSLVINVVNDYDFPENNLNEVIMEKLVTKANEKVLNKGNKKPKYQGMGTTLSVGAILHNTLYYGHVGDSRIYLHRNKNLRRISQDDSLVAQLREEGKITKKEAFHHPRSNVLTQAIGLEKSLNIEAEKIKLQSNDLLLFCTDGLTDMIPEETIETILSDFEKEMVEEICDYLLQKALAAGGTDNITLVACFFS